MDSQDYFIARFELLRLYHSLRSLKDSVLAPNYKCMREVQRWLEPKVLSEEACEEEAWEEKRKYNAQYSAEVPLLGWWRVPFEERKARLRNRDLSGGDGA